MDPVIATEHLTTSYGSRRGIEDLSFDVEPGEIFGFLGPNGAGKSTTIRTLLDLLRPTSGTARLFGLDSHRDEVAIHRRTGYLAGDVALYERMTGRELLEYFGNLRGGVDPRRVDALAERFGLDPSVRIRQLSHGNQQKVALVQAFMHEPDLAILDEPTQGLDPLVQQEFMRLLEEMKAAGRTVFLSSHVLSEVERVCDRVAIVREGRLVEVEHVADLTARAFRYLTVRFDGEAPAGVLEGVPGVQDLQRRGAVVRCTVRGDMDPVVKALAPHRVVDLVSEKPSLEEIFLAFYGASEAVTTRSEGDASLDGGPAGTGEADRAP
jgi:ABC-2 type transport system ATP-binding protein